MNPPPPRQTIADRARLNLRADKKIGFGAMAELEPSAVAVAAAVQTEIDALRAEVKQLLARIEQLAPSGRSKAQ